MVAVIPEFSKCKEILFHYPDWCHFELQVQWGYTKANTPLQDYIDNRRMDTLKKKKKQKREQFEKEYGLSKATELVCEKPGPVLSSPHNPGSNSGEKLFIVS